MLVEFAVDSVQKLKLHEQRRKLGAERRAAEAAAAAAAGAEPKAAPQGKDRAQPSAAAEARAAKRPSKPPPSQPHSQQPPSQQPRGKASNQPRGSKQPPKDRALASEATTRGADKAAAKLRPTSKGNPERRERIEEHHEIESVLRRGKRQAQNAFGEPTAQRRRANSADAREEARFESLVGSYKKMLGARGSSFEAKLGEWTR